MVAVCILTLTVSVHAQKAQTISTALNHKCKASSIFGEVMIMDLSNSYLVILRGGLSQ